VVTNLDIPSGLRLLAIHRWKQKTYSKVSATSAAVVDFACPVTFIPVLGNERIAIPPVTGNSELRLDQIFDGSVAT
jgi:hypothetical protein